MEIKTVLKKITNYEGSFLQRWIVSAKAKRKARIRHALLKELGRNELQLMFNVANKKGVNVWLEFGTLLGAYREKSFISHDVDLDVGMMLNDYTLDFENELLAVGFTKKRVFYLKNMKDESERLTEVTLSYQDFNIDIFLSHTNGNSRSVYVYTNSPYSENSSDSFYAVKEFVLPLFEKVENVEIDGIELKSPGNPHNVLSIIYGENYMIPDSTWETTKSNLNVTNHDVNCLRGIMKGVW